MAVPYAVAARALLRDTLLDAAHDLLRNHSWTEVTMAEVARAAGVSRQTLYKEFGSRDEFAQAFVLREGDRFLIAVEQAVRAHAAQPARALEAAFDVFLSAAAENPLVRAVLNGEDGGSMLPLVTTKGEPLVARVAERLTDVMVSAWPQFARPDAELFAECLVRLGISYAALPKGPANMTAASVTRLLGPYLERALA